MKKGGTLHKINRVFGCISFNGARSHKDMLRQSESENKIPDHPQKIMLKSYH